MDIRRIKQAIQYGWKHATEISQTEGIQKGKLDIFSDIMYCFFKYNLWSNQYKKEKVYQLSKDEKLAVCLKYQEQNNHRDAWVKDFFDNYKFLCKWGSLKYERSADLQAKRREAYRKRYGLGENCFIGYGVILNRHHYYDSTIRTGKNCLISEECIIDYTGDITLGNKVSISEGCKIFTHNHELDLHKDGDISKGSVKTPLTIGDGAWLGARVMIMPGVSEIGRQSMISAGAVVYKKIPPYAIVMGNPAKIVGFRWTPAEITEYEKKTYPEGQRIPADTLYANYDKYVKSKLKELREYTRLSI